MIPDKDREIIEKYIGHNYDIINKKIKFKNNIGEFKLTYYTKDFGQNRIYDEKINRYIHFANYSYGPYAMNYRICEIDGSEDTFNFSFMKHNKPISVYNLPSNLLWHNHYKMGNYMSISYKIDNDFYHNINGPAKIEFKNSILVGKKYFVNGKECKDELQYLVAIQDYLNK